MEKEYVECWNCGGTDIPRKRNLYKKDSEGFYYIPEISGGN